MPRPSGSPSSASVGPATTPIGSPTPPPPPTPPRLTLNESLVLALQQSPDLQIGLSQIKAAYVQVQQQRVPLNPTASASSNYQRTLFPSTSPLYQGFGLGLDNFTNALIINQTIYTFEKVQWGTLAAELARRQATQEYRQTLETLLQTTENNYIETQLQEANVGIARELLAQRVDYLTTSRNLYKAGEVAYFDILQYEASVGQARQSLLAAELSRDQALSTLLVSLNLPSRLRMTLTPLDASSQLPPEFAAGLQRALLRRPELAALRWALGSAQAAVHFAALSSAPTLSVQTTLTNSNSVVNGLQWTSGLVLNLPVFDGNAARLQKQLQLEALEQTRQRLEASRRSVILDVTVAYEQLSNIWDQLKVAQKATDDAREALRIAGVRYREGASSTTELLNTQSTFITQFQALVQAQANYRTALANWRRAISDEYPVALPENLKVNWELPPVNLSTPSKDR